MHSTKKTAIEKDADLTNTFKALEKLKAKFQKRFDESFEADDFEDVAILENAISAIKAFQATTGYFMEVINTALEKNRQTDLRTWRTIEQQKRHIDVLETNYIDLHELVRKAYIRKPQAPNPGLESMG